MKKEMIILIAILSFVIFDFAKAETYGVEWNVLNITNDFVDESNITYGKVVNYISKNDSLPELEVIAGLEADFWWAEVQINTTNNINEINFGKVEKGNTYTKNYTIKARGTVDIIVTPKLKNPNDEFFSNLKFSSSSSSNSYKQIGQYNLNFTNLNKQNKEWCVLLANGTLRKENETTAKGTQYIRLDLTNFKGIIPFDTTFKNTVIFQITPVWSSVEPVPENKVKK